MRSRYIAAGVAVAAALSLVPAAGAQESVDDAGTAVSSPTTEPTEPSTPADEPDEPTDEPTDPTGPADEPTDEPTDPTEPTTDPTQTPGAVVERVAVEAIVEGNGSMQSVDVATVAAVAGRLPANTPVQWKFDGARPDVARALTADGRLYVAPAAESTTKIPVIAVETATGRTVLAVDVTITAKAAGKFDNPDATRQPTTAKDIAIIVGSVLGVIGLLAAMVQFLVPGGWDQVIRFYS